MEPTDLPLRLAFLGDPNSIHFRRWTGWFAERGHTVVMLAPEGAAEPQGLHAAISVERFEPYYRRANHLVGFLREKRSLGRVVARFRPDIVHAHYLTEYGWHAWMSGFHPYAITVWGSDVNISLRRSRRTALFGRLSLRRAELVTGVSEVLVEGAIQAGARPEKSRKVHFGVDTERFAPGPDPTILRERLGLTGRRVVFAPRSIAPLYRHQVAVEALAELPEDVVLLMVRFLPDEAEVAAVMARAEALGLSSRLKIVDSIDHADLPDFYRLADVVLSIPASDATAVTLLEAAACERPIVATDLPGPRELLGQYDPECMVPVDDPKATAAAVVRALGRAPQDWAAIGPRGRRIVVDTAQHEANMLLVESLYRDMARPRRDV